MRASIEACLAGFSSWLVSGFASLTTVLFKHAILQVQQYMSGIDTVEIAYVFCPCFYTIMF